MKLYYFTCFALSVAVFLLLGRLHFLLAGAWVGLCYAKGHQAATWGAHKIGLHP